MKNEKLSKTFARTLSRWKKLATRKSLTVEDISEIRFSGRVQPGLSAIRAREGGWNLYETSLADHADPSVLTYKYVPVTHLATLGETLNQMAAINPVAMTVNPEAASHPVSVAKIAGHTFAVVAPALDKPAAKPAP